VSRGRLLVSVLALAVAPALVACRDTAPALDAAPDGDGFPYPPPRTDVAPPIGSPDTLEIAAWNIENFPAEVNTPGYVADLITSLDLDVIVVEEIASEAAWTELLERLREHDGILSPHKYNATDYQKIGVIYRASMVTPGNPTLLFPTEAYNFPRPPLSLPLTIDDHEHAALQLQVIGVHLKAGVGVEDGQRRRAAVAELDAYLRAQVGSGGEDEVIIAGDYNEIVTTAEGQANLAPFLAAPDQYTVRTQANATSGEISFVPSGRLLDHITTTAGLEAELAGARVVIPRLQSIYSGYVNHVSDHLPVVLVVPLQPAP
jgi:endonuclease/exonuclease/phosphatase family metal-dependent hydrolase